MRMFFTKTFWIFNVMDLRGNFATELAESGRTLERKVALLAPV